MGTNTIGYVCRFANSDSVLPSPSTWALIQKRRQLSPRVINAVEEYFSAPENFLEATEGKTCNITRPSGCTEDQLCSQILEELKGCTRTPYVHNIDDHAVA